MTSSMTTPGESPLSQMTDPSHENDWFTLTCQESAKGVSSENWNGQHFTPQGVVLYELQHQLAQVDPVEEADANGNDASWKQ